MKITRKLTVALVLQALLAMPAYSRNDEKTWAIGSVISVWFAWTISEAAHSSLLIKEIESDLAVYKATGELTTQFQARLHIMRDISALDEVSNEELIEVLEMAVERVEQEAGEEAEFELEAAAQNGI